MKYTRDPVAVTANFEVNASKQVICKNNCRIQVPKGYFEHGLGQIGVETFVFGLFAVILDTGQYALVNTTAMFQIAPSSTTIISIEGLEYYEFSFPKDTVIFKTTGLLSDAKIVYEVFQNFFFKARLPWYVGYEDHGKIFDNAPKFAGFNALRNPETAEFLTAMIARKAGSSDNEFLRVVAESYDDVAVGKVEFTKMDSPITSVRSTLNKIAGAYAQDGIISATVSPSESVGTVEKIIRA